MKIRKAKTGLSRAFFPQVEIRALQVGRHKAVDSQDRGKHTHGRINAVLFRQTANKTQPDFAMSRPGGEANSWTKQRERGAWYS